MKIASVCWPGVLACTHVNVSRRGFQSATRRKRATAVLHCAVPFGIDFENLADEVERTESTRKVITHRPATH